MSAAISSGARASHSAPSSDRLSPPSMTRKAARSDTRHTLSARPDAASACDICNVVERTVPAAPCRRPADLMGQDSHSLDPARCGRSTPQGVQNLTPLVRRRTRHTTARRAVNGRRLAVAPVTPLRVRSPRMAETGPPDRDAPDSVLDVKPSSVRFSDAAHQFIERVAREQGVTFAQFVREAAMARAWMEIGAQRGDLERELRKLYEAVRAAEPPPRRPSGS